MQVVEQKDRSIVHGQPLERRPHGCSVNARGTGIGAHRPVVWFGLGRREVHDA